MWGGGSPPLYSVSYIGRRGADFKLRHSPKSQPKPRHQLTVPISGGSRADNTAQSTVHGGKEEHREWGMGYNMGKVDAAPNAPEKEWTCKADPWPVWVRRAEAAWKQARLRDPHGTRC